VAAGETKEGRGMSTANLATSVYLMSFPSLEQVRGNEIRNRKHPDGEKEIDNDASKNSCPGNLSEFENGGEAQTSLGIGGWRALLQYEILMCLRNKQV